MENTTDLRKILTGLREEFSLTQADLARELDVDRSYLSQIENGKKEAGSKLAERIRILGRQGIVKKSQYQTQSQQMESRLLEAPAIYHARRLKIIPILSFVQAGLMSSYEEIPYDWPDGIATDCPNPKAFALRLRGDSMLPQFPEGTLITVMPDEEPKDGGLVVAKMTNEDAAFKIYQRQERPVPTITLSSYNLAFKAIEYQPEDFRWIWPVYESRRYH